MHFKLITLIILFLFTHPAYSKNLDTLFIKGNRHLDKSVFYKQPSFKAISINLEKNEILPEHTVPFDALLICLTGEATYYISGKSLIIREHDYHAIKKGISHKIVAQKNSQFILIRP